MKIVAKSEKPVMVIAKTETPWTMDGRSGVTCRLGVVCDDDVEKIKVASKEILDAVRLGEKYYLQIAVTVSNGSVREPKIEGVIPVISDKGQGQPK